MSVDVSTKTRPITRDKLALAFPNHEMRVAFENITEDVGKTLPDATNALQIEIDTANFQITALTANVQSLSARVSTLEAEVLALQQAVSDAQGLADNATSQLAVLRDGLTGALALISDLTQGPNPL